VGGVNQKFVRKSTVFHKKHPGFESQDFGLTIDGAKKAGLKSKILNAPATGAGIFIVLLHRFL
jgi:hypothetical protein